MAKCMTAEISKFALTHLLNLAGLTRPGLRLGGGSSCSAIGLARLALHQVQDGVTIICISLIQILSSDKMIACMVSIAHRLVIRDKHFIFDWLIFVRHPDFSNL